MVIISDRWLRFFTLFVGGMDAAGITIWPFIFISTKVKVTDRLINHERIHLRQQLEMLVIPFYVVYLIEFYTKGYMNVSFEKEAYGNDNDLLYLTTRKPYSFIKYFKHERKN